MTRRKGYPMTAMNTTAYKQWLTCLILSHDVPLSVSYVQKSLVLFSQHKRRAVHINSNSMAASPFLPPPPCKENTLFLTYKTSYEQKDERSSPFMEPNISPNTPSNLDSSGLPVDTAEVYWGFQLSIISAAAMHRLHDAIIWASAEHQRHVSPPQCHHSSCCRCFCCCVWQSC